MRRFILLIFVGVCCLWAGPAGEDLRRARDLERAGQAAEARTLLARTVKAFPADVEGLLAYAEFLDRYRDPEAIAAYEKTLQALGEAGPQQTRRQVTRRLLILSLLQDDQDAANRYVSAYRQAGGTELAAVEQAVNPPQLNEQTGAEWIQIPGPLYSFQRMAALSTDQEPDELLPALARNVVTSGYRATRGAETLEQTEYMKLVIQYLSQARELVQFAGANETINVPACESSETAAILKILGFRLRNECGPEAVLETVNPSRAFLSIDSGFPLAELEDAFRNGKPFALPFPSTQLPVLFGKDYWLEGARKKAKGEFIDVFLDDPALARLYVALGKIHRPTALQLRRDIAAERLKNFAHVLDFFGEMFEIRNGKVRVPGGARTEEVWKDLVGVSSERGAEFLQQLIEKDDGWMASYFDALARVNGPALAYFSEPKRLKRFYLAVRGEVTSPGPARPIFRANSEMLLLTARVHFTAGGAPHIPGGIEPWKRLFVEHPHGQYDGKLTRSASGWKDADDVVEAMFALTRKSIENEPLYMFLAISNLDRFRSKPFAAATVDRLLLAFPDYGDQFLLFNDAPMLSDESVVAYLDLMERLGKMRNLVRRSDAIGMTQGLVGIWQILRRQGQIPDGAAESSLRAVIDAFYQAQGDEEIFDAGRAGVKALLAATGSPEDVSPQDRLIELLAGNPGPGDGPAHQEMISKLAALFNQQRLVSLKTIFDLADHLERVSRGESFNVAMANRLAANISEVRLPRSDLSTAEANAFAQGHWVERHIRQQRSMNLNRAVDRAQGRPDELLQIRGELAGILRDALVGLNYIYYSPPGGELIRANPLFVRSHNFLGLDGKQPWRASRVQGTGWPSSGGGRLVGALINLPYALADAEQNFLVPSERQALIWQDLAPQILLSATVPRWWGVSASELHFVGLNLRLGEELVAQAAADRDLRARVFEILERQVEPARLEQVSGHLDRGQFSEGIAQLTAAERFHLASTFFQRQRDDALRLGAPFAAEIEQLLSESGGQISYQRVASAFGTPHPELSGSYRLELLNLPLFPTMMGYSSRIMAESWESTNLHWAALADEMHLPPAHLNLRIPEWTSKSLERIFATHLEDWPALWRSLQIVADRYREQATPIAREAASASRN